MAGDSHYTDFFSLKEINIQNAILYINKLGLWGPETKIAYLKHFIVEGMENEHIKRNC